MRGGIKLESAERCNCAFREVFAGAANHLLKGGDRMRLRCMTGFGIGPEAPRFPTSQAWLNTGIRIWSSSNDWAQSGRQKSAVPEVPRCQVDAQKALPGRHHRTSIAVPKMPSLTLLTGRESSGAPTTSKRVAYRGHTGGKATAWEAIATHKPP
jgi:hypothetical protein